MADLTLIIAGLFLPLFPLSMVFNTLFSRITNNKQRNILLLLWPQIGLLLIYFADTEIPDWLAIWGLLTALLYGFRLLAIREMKLWISFLATSTWAILWVTLHYSGDNSPIYIYALSFSVPLILLLLLSDELEQRFGAAYTGIYGGLALTQPRLSGVLVMVVLAVAATPLFPAFFTMLATVMQATASSLIVAISTGIVWLLWSWAGALLLQGTIVGPANETNIADLNTSSTRKYVAALISLIIIGLVLIGGLP